MYAVKNPYKPLFILGVLFGLMGVLIWLFFDVGLIAFYPRRAHIQIMFFAFFWSFVAGFLMTAIPHMTDSRLTCSLEVWLASSLVLVQFILNFFNRTDLAVFFYFIQLIFLLFFILSRFQKKRKLPFAGFLFLPAAFFLAIFGLINFIFYKDYKTLFLFAGEGFILNLIIGLGSRLVPALSRLPNLFMSHGTVLSFNYKAISLKVFFLNLSFFVEYLGLLTMANVLRLIILSYIGVVDFGLFKRGIVFGWLGLGLKMAIVFTLLGHGLRVVTSQFVSSSHLVYIGGFTLLTIMVATRVTLAHSQSNLDYELNSKRIALICFLLLLGAVLRWNSTYSIDGTIFWSSVVLFAISMVIWLDKHLRLTFNNCFKSY